MNVREHREFRDSTGVLAVAPAEAARLSGSWPNDHLRGDRRWGAQERQDRQAPANHHRSTEGVAACSRGCRVTTSAAAALAQALGGRKAGGTWMARCPAHDDRSPSLSISSSKDGKVLVRCHAGCDQRDVIAALRARGLWQTTGRALGRLPASHPHRIADEPDRRRPEAQRGGARHLAGIASGRGNAGRDLSPLARARPSGFRRRCASMPG